jgi:hypothetical protein
MHFANWQDLAIWMWSHMTKFSGAGGRATAPGTPGRLVPQFVVWPVRLVLAIAGEYLLGCIE